MSYTPHKFKLTDRQIKSLATAVRTGEGVNLRLTPQNYEGEHKLLVTGPQYTRLVKQYKAGKGMDLRLSKAQINAMRNDHEITGGFLGPLLATLATTFLPSAIKKVGEWITGNKSGDGINTLYDGTGDYNAIKHGGSFIPAQWGSDNTGNGLFLSGTQPSQVTSGKGSKKKTGGIYTFPPQIKQVSTGGINVGGFNNPQLYGGVGVGATSGNNIGTMGFYPELWGSGSEYYPTEPNDQPRYPENKEYIVGPKRTPFARLGMPGFDRSITGLSGTNIPIQVNNNAQGGKIKLKRMTKKGK